MLIFSTGKGLIFAIYSPKGIVNITVFLEQLKILEKSSFHAVFRKI